MIIVLPARNASQGPWTADDILNLLDARELENGIGMVERRVQERMIAPFDDGHYFASTPATAAMVRQLVGVPEDRQVQWLGTTGHSLLGRSYLQSEDLPDGSLFLCRKNPDPKSRRDVVVAIMTGASPKVLFIPRIKQCSKCGHIEATSPTNPLGKDVKIIINGKEKFRLAGPLSYADIVAFQYGRPGI
jgi:hypothetical protein